MADESIQQAASTDVLDASVVASLRRLGQRAGRDVFRELTGLFLETSTEALSNIHRNVREGDLTEVARIAHSVKGSSSVIGGYRMASVAADLEEIALQGEAGAVQQSVACFEHELRALRAALEPAD